jgi:hypothetical protein
MCIRLRPISYLASARSANREGTVVKTQTRAKRRSTFFATAITHNNVEIKRRTISLTGCCATCLRADSREAEVADNAYTQPGAQHRRGCFPERQRRSRRPFPYTRMLADCGAILSIRSPLSSETRGPALIARCNRARSPTPSQVSGLGASSKACTSFWSGYGTRRLSVFLKGIARPRRTWASAAGSRCCRKRKNDRMAAKRMPGFSVLLVLRDQAASGLIFFRFFCDSTHISY